MAISDYIEDALDALTREEDLDLLVFGFWGHGFSPNPQEHYLCGKNTAEDRLARTAVHLDIVKANLSQTGAHDTLLVLDCCQNRPITPGRGVEEVQVRGAEGRLDGMARLTEKMSEPGIASLLFSSRDQTPDLHRA